MKGKTESSKNKIEEEGEEEEDELYTSLEVFAYSLSILNYSCQIMASYFFFSFFFGNLDPQDYHVQV